MGMFVKPLLCLLAAASAAIAAQEAAREQGPRQVGETGERIATLVRNAEAFGFSGAVLAAKDGVVVAAVAVGHADLEGVAPNTPDTLFEIASATKQFTGAAVMRLVQDGKLDLDAPIKQILPETPDNCRAITVRHLLQHTSGIPSSNYTRIGKTFKMVLAEYLRGGPTSPPGTTFDYWNQGYVILSEIIARASGTSYTNYCAAQLFEPAGMTLTRFNGDPPPDIEGVTVAVGRSVSGQHRSALAHPYGNTYGFQYRGTGGVVTNVWDLWRWDRALRRVGDDAILQGEALSTLFQPGRQNYACGWFVTTDSRGRTMQHHGGSVRGFACSIARFPDDDGCIFVLANRDDAPTREVWHAVHRILFFDPEDALEMPAPLPPALAGELAGRFKDADGNVLVLSNVGVETRATIYWTTQWGVRTHAHLGVAADGEPALFEWRESTPLKLEEDENGSIVAIDIHGRRWVRAP